MTIFLSQINPYLQQDANSQIQPLAEAGTSMMLTDHHPNHTSAATDASKVSSIPPSIRGRLLNLR